MADQPPTELSRLLGAADLDARHEAWEAFIQHYSRLLMHAARSLGGGYDGAMDRYTHVLDQLRADDFKRLRAYSAKAGTKFSTWLVVVSRRICVDYHRSLYGRQRATGNPDPVREERANVRKHLADFIAAQVDLDQLSDGTKSNPETSVVQAELRRAVAGVLGTLPNRDRLLLALRFEDDAPAREIADVMGFPSQFHVYRRLKQVLADLRLALEKLGVDDPNL
jgi:RNA polymerase sigma factor (sigma-70 family)